MQIVDDQNQEFVHTVVTLEQENDAFLQQIATLHHDFFLEKEDNLTNLGAVTDVYPVLNIYKDDLSEHLYDYYILETPKGARIMVNHISNNCVHFVCEGSFRTTSHHIQSLFTKNK